MSITLAALDHDVLQKDSITPSVLLDIAIPETMDESFYRGQVYATLKDSVLEPSSPNRFAAEICKYWDSLPVERTSSVSALLLFTDGGPEHRTTYESAKLSLIHVFRHTKVELLVAARTAPGQSFINLVERVMSIINIALQSVAVERSSCSEEVEAALKGCGTVDSIHKKEALVKQEWTQSIATVARLISERIERCTLKDTPFRVLPAATTEDIDHVWTAALTIDTTLERDKLQQQFVKKKNKYLEFKVQHCRERHYCFQV